MIPTSKLNFEMATIKDSLQLKGADLVNRIKKENQQQDLGQVDGRLVVPELITDGKIFLRTALIREAHEPQIFAHLGQNKVIQMLQ
jgi:hypothetical protein